MASHCPPVAAQTKTCATGGCIPTYSQPTAKLSCGPSCAGGGNLPNGPLDPCPACPGLTFPEACPKDICRLSGLARIIVSIVRIRSSDGATEDQILQEHNNVV